MNIDVENGNQPALHTGTAQLDEEESKISVQGEDNSPRGGIPPSDIKINQSNESSRKSVEEGDSPIIRLPLKRDHLEISKFNDDKEDDLEFDLHQDVRCSFGDNSIIYDAQIIGKKEVEERMTYYVHFLGQDKRMDKWVEAENLRSHIGELKAEFPPGVQKTSQALNNIVTRKQQRIQEELNPKNQDLNEMNPEMQELEKQHQERTKVRNIHTIVMGFYEINTWYFSPYPEEYGHQDLLYVCEFCLKYMCQKESIISHREKCKMQGPPGRRIYIEHPFSGYPQIGDPRVDPVSISIYEIDGSEHKLYCQNMCLMAKLFLDHKTLYFDVSPFKFYVLTEDNAYGSHIAAYFSKDKMMMNDHNLSCIMTLPPYQRKGYGKLLISLSYHLSRMEQRICTPEKPLSDMGKISYKSYWTDALLDTLRLYHGNLSIKELSQITYIKIDDIISTLTSLGLVKYWKGQHVLSTVSNKTIDEHFKNKEIRFSKSNKPNIQLNIELLHM